MEEMKKPYNILIFWRQQEDVHLRKKFSNTYDINFCCVKFSKFTNNNNIKKKREINGKMTFFLLH